MRKKPFIRYSIDYADYGWVYLLYSYATDAARQTSMLRTLIHVVITRVLMYYTTTDIQYYGQQ